MGKGGRIQNKPFAPMRTAFAPRLAFLVIGLLLPAPLRAQPLRPAYTDTLRALVVFARFRDDRFPGDPTLDARDWPLSEAPERPPAFARRLLAPSPEPPFPDSSLTAYFFTQSNGRFLLFGDALDTVMVSLHPEAHYHRPNGGYGDLTREILDRLDRAGFDFAPYDHDGDGRLDHLFLILRGDSKRDDKTFAWTGVSCLDARCGPGPPHGPPRERPVHDGVEVDWNTSGSIILHRTPGNVLPYHYLIRMMAHELGHDLWAKFFVHVPALVDNDVPLRSNRSARGTDAIGYVLMAGAGGGRDCRGDQTISAFERDLLGWIDCETMSEGRNGVRLTDLYTTSACVKIPLANDARGRTLFLTNRQRLGPFDRLRRGGAYGQYDFGLLRTTGLLVTMAEGVRFDVLPADDTLDLSIFDADYDGDLFGPATKRQLTPWTRPNTSGFTRYPPGFRPDWRALDDVRYTGAPGGEMAFDLVDDFRERPVIRADSWIGDETKGHTFARPMRVTDGSTLTLGTRLTFARMLRVEPGATVVVAPGALVTLAPGGVLDLEAGARVVVEGTLVLDGLLGFFPGATLLTRNGGRIVSRLARKTAR